MARCDVCFRHCELRDGQVGSCGARAAEGGEVRPVYYGKVSALALDPIEKKPLAMFHPGSRILSVGMLGCNLHCPFCQNHEIAQREGGDFLVQARDLSPAVLAEMADNCRDMGNIGVAFTYNEPLVCWEYVRDTAKLVHEKGMLNVMVTNGCAELGILEKLSPEQFLRIHKSYIVSLARIREAKRSAVTLDDGTLLPIGESYRNQAWSRIGKKTI